MSNQIVRQIDNIADAVESKFNKLRKDSNNQDIRIRTIDDRLLGLEQSGLTPTSGGIYSGSGERFGNSGNSLSKKLSQSPDVKNFLEKNTSYAGLSIATNAILPSISNNTIISSPATNPEQRLPGVVGGPEQKMWLRQLFPVFMASSSSFVYTRESTFTNNAEAQTAEGALKAESDVTYEEVLGEVSTYAHWLKVSRQIMLDSPDVINFTAQRLSYGLELQIESALINGDGAVGKLSGLLDVGNFTAFSPTIADTAVDSLRKARLALENANFQAGLIILNPADMSDIELLKDADNNYLVGQPVRGGLSTLWGVPVYTTTAMAAGQFIALDSQQAVSIHLREQTQLKLSDSADDNFTKNLVTMLAETRLGFAVHLPAGVISGLLVTA